jgi:hypothetical protein
MSVCDDLVIWEEVLLAVVDAEELAHRHFVVEAAHNVVCEAQPSATSWRMRIPAL